MPNVLRVSDADGRRVQQADDCGEHPLAGQAGKPKVAGHPGPQPRKRPADGGHPPILRLVSRVPPPVVVAVLLPSPGVAAGGLEVAVGNGADPDVRPCGRNGQGADPGERFRRPDPATARTEVYEAVALPFAPDAGRRIADVAQTGGFGRFNGLEQRRDCLSGGHVLSIATTYRM